MSKAPELKFHISINGKEVKNTLNGVRGEVSKVKKELSKLTRGTKEYKEKTKELKAVTKVYKEMQSEIRETPTLLQKAGKEFKLLAIGVASVFTLSSMLSYFSTLKAKVGELRKLKHIIKSLTQLEGEALADVTAKSKALADAFEEDTQKMHESANALSKNMGISFDKALELIQQGFLKGADANGEFLDKVREYPALLKEAGLSAEQSIKLMEQEVKTGIYSDKGVDAIKEANLRLREMPKSTADALNAIGLSAKTMSEELASGKKSIFEVIQQVSKRMDTLPPQSKQVGQAIADIFGGPGEDAGYRYLSQLHNINLSLQDTTEETDDYTKAKLLEIEANKSLNKVWLELTDTVGTFNLIYNSLKLQLAQGLSYFLKLIGVSKDADSSIIKLRSTLSTIIKMLLVGVTAYVSYNAAIRLTALLTKNATKSTLLHTIALKANAMGVKLVKGAVHMYQMVLALCTGNLKKARMAMIAFNIATKLNPIGLVITAITAGIVAFKLFSDTTDAATRKQQALYKAQQKAASSVAKEEAAIQKLLIVAKNEALSKEERNKAIKRLNEIAPEYLNNITLENINTKKTTQSIEEYIKVLKKQAEQKALLELWEETVKKRREAESSSLEEHIKWYDYATSGLKALAGMSTFSANMTQKANDRKKESIAALTESENNYLEHYYSHTQEIHKVKQQTLERDKQDLKTRATLEETARKLKIKNIENATNKELEVAISKEIEKNNKLASARNKAAAAANTQREKEREARLQKEEEFRAQLLLQSGTEIQKEMAAHKERLQKAGLYHKQRYQMTSSELKVLEVLELKHATELVTIENKAIQTHLEGFKKGYERQKAQRQTAHNNEILNIQSLGSAKKILQQNLSAQELQNITTLKDAKAALNRQHEKEELTHQEEFLKKQIGVLQSVLSGENTSINLADQLLTEEQKELLNTRIDELKLKLSEVGIKQEEEENTEVEGMEGEGEGPDIFGYTAEDWKDTFNNLDTVQQKMKATQMVVQGLQEVWGMYDRFMSAQEEKQLSNFEKKNKKKKKDLQNRLDSGAISQDKYYKEVEKLDQDLAKKKAELEYKQAKRAKVTGIASTISNTSIAIMKAYAELGPVGGTIAAAIVGTLGAIQINTILKQPLPDKNGYAKGGFTKGLGYKDATGEVVAGTVHDKEYVIPKTVLYSNDPAVPQMVNYLENKRLGKTATYTNEENTETSPTPKAPVFQESSTVTVHKQSSADLYYKSAVLFNESVNKLIENGIIATALIGDQEIQDLEARKRKIQQARTGAKNY